MVGLNVNGRNNDEVFDSDVVIRDNRIQSTTRTRVRLDRETGSIFTHNNDGDITFQWDMPGNNLFFGGHGQDGDLAIFPRDVNSFQDLSRATFHFNGQQAVARLGGNQIPGQIICQDEANEQTVFINGAEGQIIAGANGKNGTVSVQDSQNRRAILLEGDSGRIVAQNLQLRSPNGGNSIFLGGEDSIMLLSDTLRLEGNSGTIVSQNLQIRSSTTNRNSIFLGGEDSLILIGQSLRLDGTNGTVEASEVQTSEIVFSDGTSQSTAQLQGPEGPRGPRGHQGSQGPQGPQGVSGTADFSAVQARVFEGAAANRAINTIRADGTIAESIDIDGQASDRAMKMNFQPVDSLDVLEKLNSVPINRWSWKEDDPSIIHMGPTAQDFYAAFGLGNDDRQIKHVDASGVAFASIQALHSLLFKQASLITKLEKRIDVLEMNLKSTPLRTI